MASYGESKLLLLLLPTPTVAAGRVFSGICLFVCPSVSLSVVSHDISKVAAARITKLGIEMYHDQSWKPIYFGIKRSSQLSRKYHRRGSLHSCECWLPLVDEALTSESRHKGNNAHPLGNLVMSKKEQGQTIGFGQCFAFLSVN